MLLLRLPQTQVFLAGPRSHEGVGRDDRPAAFPLTRSVPVSPPTRLRSRLTALGLLTIAARLTLFTHTDSSACLTRYTLGTDLVVISHIVKGAVPPTAAMVLVRLPLLITWVAQKPELSIVHLQGLHYEHDLFAIIQKHGARKGLVLVQRAGHCNVRRFGEAACGSCCLGYHRL